MQEVLASVQANRSEDVNPFSMPTLYVDPRLTDEDRWYVVSDPATSAGLELAYLAGSPGPQFDTHPNFLTDTVDTKVRLDVMAKPKVPATLDWIAAFAAQADADGLPHISALALFLFGTGARVGEATALRWADVDLGAATATIRLYKPRPWTRAAHLPPPVVAALARIPFGRDPEARVFGLAGRGSVTKTWNGIAARAGLAPLTPHCARHGFATAMLRKGMDVATVAARGGWRDPSTVLRTYAHAIEDITVTDALFGTPVTQGADGAPVTTSSKRRK